MGLMDFLFGSPGRVKQISTLTPEQQQLHNLINSGMMGPMQGGMNYLSGLFGGGDEAFKAYEAPFMRQFQEQTVPGLAERFAGMGAGAQSGSGFAQALSSAGAGLSENLAAQRANLRQNALSQMLGLSQLGLGTKAFENMQIPGSQGLVGQIAPFIGAGATMGMGSLLGPATGMMGNVLSNWLSKKLGLTQAQTQGGGTP